MDELDVLTTLAERGEVRGAAAVWRAAVLADNDAVDDIGTGAGLHGDVGPSLELPAPKPFTPRRRPGLLLATAAVSVLVAVAGMVVLRRAREPEAKRPGATGSTLAPSTSPPSGSPLAALVNGALPEGFVLASSSRSTDGVDAVAIDRDGRLLDFDILVDGAALARTTSPTGGPQLLDGVPAGSRSDAVVVTTAGDALRGRCWIGDLPCEQVDGGSTVDLRAVLGDVARKLDGVDRVVLSSAATAADAASLRDSQTILDRIETQGLGALGVAGGFEPAASAGPGPARTWRAASNPDAIVTVRALPLLTAPQTVASTIGATANAAVAGEGWVVVATARDLVSGSPPVDSAQLARVVRFGLSGLAAVPAASDLAGSGKLVLDPVPAGWTASPVSDGRDATDTSTVVRVYVGSSSGSGATTFLSLTASARGGQAAPDAPNVVDVNGTRGEIVGLDDRTRRLTFGPVGGLFAELDAIGVDDAQLVTIAAGVERAADGVGLSIRADALPPGTSERAVGFRGALGFTPIDSVAAPIPVASWTDDRAFIKCTSFRASPDVLLAYRQRLQAAQDTSINGHAGFAGGTGSYRLVGWADADRVFLVESNTANGTGSGVDVNDLVRYAADLRPATLSEWAAMAGPTTTPNGSPVTTTG